MAVDLQIEMKAERARKTLEKLLSRVTDMTPIWKYFRQYWQDVLMPESWNSKGKLMEGQRWIKLTDKYRAWKQSSKNTGSKELLKLSGKLFEAAQGGSGWYDKIEKKSLVFGIDFEYAYWVQHRMRNPRYYFYTKNEDIPNKAYAYLIKITDEFLEDADK